MDLLRSLLDPDLATLGMIIVIDVVMSGDNAIIIGMAASGLPPALRRRAIVLGIVGATVIRIVFAAAAYQLLKVLGLMLAGGLLLLWVCWRMWRDLRATASEGVASDRRGASAGPKSLRAAMVNIVVADVSMSLDNVLAVAGAARDHFGMLVFGLVLSIALMGVMANYIAGLLERHKWIAYLGLLIIVYVAFSMIWRGWQQVSADVMGVAKLF